MIYLTRKLFFTWFFTEFFQEVLKKEYNTLCHTELKAKLLFILYQPKCDLRRKFPYKGSGDYPIGL